MSDAAVAGTSARVVVLGSINVDLGVRVPAFPQPGETVAGGDLVISPGGKGANQAVAAALTGADVTMVGAVGTDRFAEAALAGLRRAGVDVARVRAVDGATGTALITVDGAGENTIIVSPGANGQVGDDDAEIAAALLVDGVPADDELQVDGAARTAQVAGGAGAVEPVRRREPAVLVLQGEIDPRIVDRCVDAVRDRAHVRILVNAAPVTDLSARTLTAASPLVVNESEARLIARQIGASRGRCDSREAMEELAAGLVEWGIPAVVLTLGARGSLVAEQTTRSDSDQSFTCVVVHRVKATPARAVDTTGAGDMFVGALAAHLAEGHSLVDAAQEAAVRAAASVEHPGAQSSYFEALDERTP